jgi:hypothetical protein
MIGTPIRCPRPQESIIEVTSLTAEAASFDVPTAVAGPTGVGRVHVNHFSATFFRFAFGDRHESPHPAS